MFIVFDGIDGSGKTTLVEAISARLASIGIDALVTAEFSSALPWGPRLRRQLGEAAGDPAAQYEIVLEARKLHHNHVLLPALTAGRAVLMDRYVLSTMAYQGQTPQVTARRILDDHERLGFAEPDMTMVLDCNPSTARERLTGRGDTDKLDSLDVEFFRRARESYQCSISHRMRHDTKSNVVVNAHQSAGGAADHAWFWISDRFNLDPEATYG